jgi:hypothetical protein
MLHSPPTACHQGSPISSLSLQSECCQHLRGVLIALRNIMSTGMQPCAYKPCSAALSNAHGCTALTSTPTGFHPPLLETLTVSPTPFHLSYSHPFHSRVHLNLSYPHPSSTSGARAAQETQTSAPPPSQPHQPPPPAADSLRWSLTSTGRLPTSLE